MTSSLNIYGQTYEGVTGIKAKDTSGTMQTFVLQESINYQSKTVTPTESQQTVVPDANYDALSSVTVRAIDSNYVGTSIARKTASDLTASGATVTVPAGYYQTTVSASIPTASLVNKQWNNAGSSLAFSLAQSTGKITATLSFGASFSPVDATLGKSGYITSDQSVYIAVNGTSSYQLSVQASKTITPTEATQIALSTGYYTTGDITVGAIPSTYVGSGVTRISSANVTVSGATVTAPIGYYSSAIAKTIQNGSAITPATTLSFTPAISVNASGLVTATVSGSSSITPTVTTGYVSAGTAGTVSVSGSKTYQLTTQGATTYNTSTTDQTISSGRYLTGTQTIKAVTVSGLNAANIASGVIVKVGDANDDDRIASVTGTLSFVTYYTGTSVPANSLGSNGDIYLQTGGN